MPETWSLAEAKAHLSELVARAGTEHERITVTVHGRPTAVLLAMEDLEALEETIAVLSDPALVRLRRLRVHHRPTARESPSGRQTVATAPR